MKPASTKQESLSTDVVDEIKAAQIDYDNQIIEILKAEKTLDDFEKELNQKEEDIIRGEAQIAALCTNTIYAADNLQRKLQTLCDQIGDRTQLESNNEDKWMKDIMYQSDINETDLLEIQDLERQVKELTIAYKKIQGLLDQKYTPNSKEFQELQSMILKSTPQKARMP